MPPRGDRRHPELGTWDEIPNIMAHNLPATRHHQVTKDIGPKTNTWDRIYSTSTNPNTNQMLSRSTVEAPTWKEERRVFPSGKGQGRRRIGPPGTPYEEPYGIQLIGPQTWGYDPGNSGVMAAAADNPMVMQAKNLYNKIDPWIPNMDFGDQEVGYKWEKPLLGGVLGYGFDYDWDDEDPGAFINWKLGLGG